MESIYYISSQVNVVIKPLLLFCFDGILFSRAAVICGLMALTKNYKMMPLRARTSVKPKNEKAYMVQPAKAVAPAAAAPALSALVGVWNPLAALIVLIAGEIACIRLGTKFMRK